MVGVSHGTNRMRVGPSNLKKRWRKGTPKWAPKGKVVNCYNFAEKRLASKLKPKIEFRRQRAFLEFRFGNISLPPTRYFHQI